jgi:hypothetical protein
MGEGLGAGGHTTRRAERTSERQVGSHEIVSGVDFSISGLSILFAPSLALWEVYFSDLREKSIFSGLWMGVLGGSRPIG